MKSVLKMLPALLVITLFTACNNFGKKVTVEGTKGEVYYKGEGVTESDAKKLGDFLKSEKFFTNDKDASAQIVNQGGSYTVRFVYDKSFYDKTPTAEAEFKTFGVQISKAVFDNKKVDIALADKYMKDFKTIPYDATLAQADNSTTKTGNNNADVSNDGKNGSVNDNNTSTINTTTSLTDYDHDVASGINFYWKGISDNQSKTIADYIVKTGSFSGGNGNNVNIIMEKQGGRYVIKFPVADGYLKNTSYLNTLESVSKQIKENVFANDAYTFVMTDTQLKNVRSWDY